MTGTAPDFKDVERLHLALKKGDMKLFHGLLDQFGRALTDEVYFGRQPLHWAVWYGRSEAIRPLLMADADMNAKDKKGNTPINCVRFSMRDFTEGSYDTLKILLEEGADLEKKNNEYSTPLMQALYAHNYPAAKLLLSYGAVTERKGIFRPKAVDDANRFAETPEQKEAVAALFAWHADFVKTGKILKPHGPVCIIKSVERGLGPAARRASRLQPGLKSGLRPGLKPSGGR